MITLVPSKNRPDILAKFLQSAIDCKTTTHGLILIDKSDWEVNKDIYSKLEKPETYQFRQTQGITMGDKVREIWPATKPFEAICLLNDDHFILTPEWDKKVKEKIIGYNFVTTNDNWRSPQKASGATVWSSGLLDAVGWPIYPPGMIHLFIDDLWEYIGKITGCWNVDHTVTIEHHHPLTGKNQLDKTFVDTYGSVNPQEFSKGAVWQNDHRIFQDIIRHEGKEIINKIRILMGLREIS